MKKLIVVLLFVVALAAAAWGWQKRPAIFQEKVEEAKKESLLPDMIVLPPKELYIQSSGVTRNLRFSTTFANIGKGELQLIGQTRGKTTYAAQYISEVNGPGEYHQVGSFVFHPEHNHWHLDEYVFYELWSLVEGEKDKLMVKTDKQSFCIWDENSYDLSLPASSKRRIYPFVCNQKTQGMSVGWSDTYLGRVEGQLIELTEIADGEYLFRSVVNPERRIVESDYENNEASVKVRIEGNRVTRL